MPTQALLPAYADHRLRMRTDVTAYGLMSGNHRKNLALGLSNPLCPLGATAIIIRAAVVSSTSWRKIFPNRGAGPAGPAAGRRLDQDGLLLLVARLNYGRLVACAGVRHPAMKMGNGPSAVAHLLCSRATPGQPGPTRGSAARGTATAKTPVKDPGSAGDRAGQCRGLPCRRVTLRSRLAVRLVGRSIDASRLAQSRRQRHAGHGHRGSWAGSAATAAAEIGRPVTPRGWPKNG